MAIASAIQASARIIRQSVAQAFFPLERVMNESEFHRAVDETLARIERAAESSRGIEADVEAGVLTLECPDGSRIIVNRQTPSREIWVAARSGGFHYAWRDGAWRDTRSGAELFASLGRIAHSQAGESLAFD